ncbi:MAG: carbohydrate ABC transporter substrate-binding protein, partial [Acholeplasmataceae bacterium]|nr:carbohydrate ABC transporter substrate-binding protein [Acholeplasmataceae bacterium]
MKKILFVITLVFLTSILISCGKKDDSVITFSWWGTSDRNVATYQAIDLFNQKYPQYKV